MKNKNNGFGVMILIVILIGAFFMISINTGPNVTPFGEFGQILVSVAIVWLDVETIRWFIKAHRGY